MPGQELRRGGHRTGKHPQGSKTDLAGGAAGERVAPIRPGLGMGVVVSEARQRPQRPVPGRAEQGAADRAAGRSAVRRA